MSGPHPARSTIPTALLLDLDDTILDFEGGAVPSWRSVCEAASDQVAGLDPAALFTAIDVARDWLWADRERARVGRTDLVEATRLIVQRALASLGFDLPDLARWTAETYRGLRDETIHPFPGAIDALSSFREAGVRLALVTNGAAADQRRKIDRFGLAPFFEQILVEGEFGVGKPDERVYRHALDSLGVAPAQAWMVGDNLEWDVAGPQRLGVTGIWVDMAGRGLPESSPVRPDRIIRALPELLP